VTMNDSIAYLPRLREEERRPEMDFPLRLGGQAGSPSGQPSAETSGPAARFEFVIAECRVQFSHGPSPPATLEAAVVSEGNAATLSLRGLGYYVHACRPRAVCFIQALQIPSLCRYDVRAAADRNNLSPIEVEVRFFRPIANKLCDCARP
jgi:hypothetical protein